MGWQRHCQGREISKAQVLFASPAAGKRCTDMVPPKLQRRELAVPTLLLYVALLSHLDYYSAADIAVADPLEPIENPQSEGGEALEVSLFNEFLVFKQIYLYSLH